MHPSLVQSFVVPTSNHSNVSSHNMTPCNLPLNLAPLVSLSTLLKPQVFALVVDTEAGSYANTRQTDSFSGCVCMYVGTCVCLFLQHCGRVGMPVCVCVCVHCVCNVNILCSSMYWWCICTNTRVILPSS